MTFEDWLRTGSDGQDVWLLSYGSIFAFAKDEHGYVVDGLLALRYDLHCVGGSHAQRDIFSQVLIESAIRSKRFELARSLLSERLVEKPNSRGSWLKNAETFEALGDAEGAAAAGERGACLLPAWQGPGTDN